MSNKTMIFSRISHRKQKTQQIGEQSPQIKRIKRITSEADSDIHLSPFDLVSWKQKLNYQPTEVIKKLKFQNDIAMHLVARQKVRTMPKMPQRKTNSRIQCFQLDTSSIRVRIPSVPIKTKFLTESQESLLAQYSSPSAKVAFKEKHQELYLKITQNSKEKQLKKVNSLKHHTQELKRQIKMQAKQKDLQKNYFKTKYDEVNKRMQSIIKNWKKSKKSVNERYHELWVKPNQHRLNLKNVNTQQSVQPTGKSSSLY